MLGAQSPVCFTGAELLSTRLNLSASREEIRTQMDIEEKTVWQHAAGDSSHDHTDLCLKWNVILIGPGEKNWLKCTDEEKCEKGDDARRFCEEMKEGDIVVLKMGLSQLRAIGVVGTYEHVDEFNDIDGWELGHARRVRWLRRKPHDFGAKVFTRNTTTRLNAQSMRAWIRRTLEPIDDGHWNDLEPLPFSSEGDGHLKLTQDKLGEDLFALGLPSDAIRDLLDPKGSFVQMANWYWTQGASEHPSTRPSATLWFPCSGSWGGRRRRSHWNMVGSMQPCFHVCREAMKKTWPLSLKPRRCIKPVWGRLSKLKATLSSIPTAIGLSLLTGFAMASFCAKDSSGQNARISRSHTLT